MCVFFLDILLLHTPHPSELQGLSDSFDELVGLFSTFSSNPDSSYTPSTHLPQVDAAQIRLWIVALSHVVSRLERTHASLVHAIVNMPWTVLDNATVKSYTIFIGMLLSARPEYLSFVLAMIAQGFTYREHFPSQSLVLTNADFDLRIRFASSRHLLARIIKGPCHTQANI